MLQRMYFLPKPRARSLSSPGALVITDAWHTVLNSDPLVDSDEECPDEHLRLDYSGSLMRCIFTYMLISVPDRRMEVITRLRGRPPTPEPACIQTIPT